MPPFAPKSPKQISFNEGDSPVLVRCLIHVKAPINYPASSLQGRYSILKDEETNTIFVGMKPGDIGIVAGIYYVDVLKGKVRILGYYLSSY